MQHLSPVVVIFFMCRWPLTKKFGRKKFHASRKNYSTIGLGKIMGVEPNVRYARVEPPLAQCTSATAVTQSTILFSSGVHVPSGLRDSGTLIYIYIYIYSIFLFSPPRDGPSSGTESNLPVSHPTPGIQIVDYLSRRVLTLVRFCLEFWKSYLDFFSD